MKKRSLQEEAKCVQKRAKGFKCNSTVCLCPYLCRGIACFFTSNQFKNALGANMPMSPVPLAGADGLFQKPQCTETSTLWQTGAAWCVTHRCLIYSWNRSKTRTRSKWLTCPELLFHPKRFPPNIASFGTAA